MHRRLADGHWRDLSLAEQMGNIGSEVGRALAWRARGEEPFAQRALERCLELIDLTLADARRIGQLKEICRAREVVCDYFEGGNQYGSTSASLERYFGAFAWLARRGR